MNKKGFSIIVLVITFITLSILLGMASFKIQNENTVDDARIAVFKSNYKECKEEYERTLLKKQKEDFDFDASKINEDFFTGLKKYMPSISRKYSEKVKIVNGELVLNEENLSKKEKKVMSDPMFSVEKIPTIADFYVPFGFELTADKLGIKDGDVEYTWIPITKESESERESEFDQKLKTIAGVDKNDPKVYPKVYAKVKESALKYGGVFISKNSYKLNLEDAMKKYVQSDIRCIVFLDETNPQKMVIYLK